MQPKIRSVAAAWAIDGAPVVASAVPESFTKSPTNVAVPSAANRAQSMVFPFQGPPFPLYTGRAPRGVSALAMMFSFQIWLLKRKKRPAASCVVYGVLSLFVRNFHATVSAIRFRCLAQGFLGFVYASLLTRLVFVVPLFSDTHQDAGHPATYGLGDGRTHCCGTVCRGFSQLRIFLHDFITYFLKMLDSSIRVIKDTVDIIRVSIIECQRVTRLIGMATCRTINRILAGSAHDVLLQLDLADLDQIVDVLVTCHDALTNKFVARLLIHFRKI